MISLAHRSTFSPVIEAEVRYATRSEYAQTATDFIARRSRLSFLNAQAALEVLPRVITIMGAELGWNASRKREEWIRARVYLESMGLAPSTDLEGDARTALKGTTSSWMGTWLAYFRSGNTKTRNLTGPSRARFSIEELDTLRHAFADNGGDDGKLSQQALRSILADLGYRNVSQKELDDALIQYSPQKDGIYFEQFLDVSRSFRRYRYQH